MARKYAPGPAHPGEMAGSYSCTVVDGVHSAIIKHLEWLEPHESGTGERLLRVQWWDGVAVTPLGLVRVYAEHSRQRRDGRWTNDFNRYANFRFIRDRREHCLMQVGDECCGFSARALAREAHRFARAVVNHYGPLRRA